MTNFPTASAAKLSLLTSKYKILTLQYLCHSFSLYLKSGSFNYHHKLNCISLITIYFYFTLLPF